MLDIMEQSATGRVLAYDPATESVRIVAHGFSFANGIALSCRRHEPVRERDGPLPHLEGRQPRERNVDVRSGSAAGQGVARQSAGLSGQPDARTRRPHLGRTVQTAQSGRGHARSEALLAQGAAAAAAGFFCRWAIPTGTSSPSTRTGHVVDDLQDPSGAYPETTGATETADRLYIHSLHAHAIGWLPRVASTKPLEEIYVLRSVREQQEPVAAWCSPDRAGFTPFPTDAERSFSFWSIRAEDGKVVDAKTARVADLRGCFGATEERARQHFYAELRLGSLSFRGNGECLALATNFPEMGLFPVRCQLVLSGLPAPYVGGLLTTNTLTSKAPFGGDTDPPGYTQASIATIRLWTASQR